MFPNLNETILAPKLDLKQYLTKNIDDTIPIIWTKLCQKLVREKYFTLKLQYALSIWNNFFHENILTFFERKNVFTTTKSVILKYYIYKNLKIKSKNKTAKF